MDFKTALGFSPHAIPRREDEQRLIEYVNLKLAARGLPIHGNPDAYPFLQLGKSLLADYKEKSRLLADHLCPVDRRLHGFLSDMLGAPPEGTFAWVPAETLVLERHGIARVVSLPPDRDSFESEIVRSYRVHQGVLHNPDKDRRTTQGVFHVAEGGLPIPADKKAVPLPVFRNLLIHALHPPRDLLRLPFTSTQPNQAETFVSLLLRPVVCPLVPGFISEKAMEVRFFAPGNLVSNLDFVESIFGNAGDPFLPENDAQLDPDRWSGHTGGVLLAPHLIYLTKKELGLPHADEATERQKRDGMCWESDDELYNDGGAFKVTCRDRRGVIFTLIADNYFGYCKKEVKTQLSFAANLYGLCEEEHAGGAIAFASQDLGEDFSLSAYNPGVDHTFAEQVERYGEIMDVRPEGYAIDRDHPDIIFVPEDVRITLQDLKVAWKKNGKSRSLKLLPGRTYVLPSGYKVEMTKPTGETRWRLVGTNAEGAYCHKPCTVSGGGKSEISKSIADAMIFGPVFTADFKKDFDQVEEIIDHDFSRRFRDPKRNQAEARPILSPERSLGSVVKLLTPGPEYTDEYNDWLRSIPGHVRDLVLVVKRFYKPDSGRNWRGLFHVDMINGQPGKELKYRDRMVVSQYLRVGFAEDGSWRIFSLRKDFCPAAKIQMEDDISASVVVPRHFIEGLNPMLDPDHPAFRFVKNCEYRLFQRPDDAIHRGYDKATEADFSRPGNFFSNFEPLTREFARDMTEDVIRFGQFTPPMQLLIRRFAAESKPDYVVSSAHPRLVDGKPSKNPRYLQNRPDLVNPRARYLGDLGARFFRRLPLDRIVPWPVNAVLPGRRNNPPDPKGGMRPLCVYGPIHYQELPELFMDFIASLTGKSPSTTGAGSEGALTKGPFNALLPIIDLNNALISYLISGYACFTTAAGHVGPKYRVDHDISYLVPEIWCRMFVKEQNPAYLIENGFLEKIEDFEHKGSPVLASRLGYRITHSFVRTFFGRVFSSPQTVLSDDMLRPELQDPDVFADGVDNIVEAQRRIALLYFEDGSHELACPPLRALLEIMAHGTHDGKDVNDPAIRALFDRETMLKSDWYKERLEAKRRIDRRYWDAEIAYLQEFADNPLHRQPALRFEIAARNDAARDRRTDIDSETYLERLYGTLGAEPAVAPPSG